MKSAKFHKTLVLFPYPALRKSTKEINVPHCLLIIISVSLVVFAEESSEVTRICFIFLATLYFQIIVIYNLGNTYLVLPINYQNKTT